MMVIEEKISRLTTTMRRKAIVMVRRKSTIVTNTADHMIRLIQDCNKVLSEEIRGNPKIK